MLAIDEEKLAQRAEKHASIVAKNIYLLDRNDVGSGTKKAKNALSSPTARLKQSTDLESSARARASPELASYSSYDVPILISLGKYTGMLVYKGWTLTGFLPAVMKEFVEWKVMVELFPPPDASLRTYSICCFW